MAYTLVRSGEQPSVEKFGMHIKVLPDAAQYGIITAETPEGHNQEFYHRVSTFHYVITDGEGTFYLDDEAVPVKAGDYLSIAPNTRIYYKGALSLVLITTPAWTEEGEVETRRPVW